jgi:membrane protease YdiL (CAAX protease family)
MVLFHAPMQYTILASFGPSVAALIVHRLSAGNYRPFRVFATWQRTIVTGGAGVALIVFTYVVLPGLATADPHTLHWSIFASTGVYNYSTLLGGPLGEEPGWRGYALPRLEARLGPVRGSLLLAFLWTGWHLPLFLIPTWSTSPLWIYALILIGLSVIMSYAANLARFAIVPSIVMHAAFNAVSRLLAGLFTDTQPNVKISFDLVLALCGLATALVLVGMTKGSLAFCQNQIRNDGEIQRQSKSPA